MMKRVWQCSLLLLVFGLFLVLFLFFWVAPKENLSAYILQAQGHSIVFNESGSIWKHPTHFSCNSKTITQRTIRRVANMPHIYSFEVRNTDLADIDMSELREIPHWLLGGNNNLTEKQIRDIADNVIEIQSFHINSIPLGKETLVAFSRHPIYQLTIRANLNDGDLSIFGDFKQLEFLRLFSQTITDEGLDFFVSMEHLKTLILHSDEISQEGIEKLQSKRPDLRITLTPWFETPCC